MIGSINVSFNTTGDIRLKGIGGEAIHKMFFNLLKTFNPEFATRIHNDDAEKAFSLSPPQSNVQFEDGYCIIKNNSTFTVRFSLLNEELFAAVISILFKMLSQEKPLYLEGTAINLLPLDMKNRSQIILSSFHKILKNADIDKKITLNFISPTTFKSQKKQFPFPLPEIVFSSYFRRWQTLSSTKLPATVPQSFDSIRVSSYALKTELIHFSNYKLIGFKGTIDYDLPANFTIEQIKSINALADFAFYCGTGAKTTMGMGQTRRIK